MFSTKMKWSARSIPPIALASWITQIAATAAFAQAEVFVNLRFYPGETIAEDRPSRPNPITISFVGRVYDPPALFPGDGTPGNPDEEFLTRVVEVNGKGSADEILALWDPEERSEIATNLANEEMFEKSRLYYKSIGESAFVAKILYGPYRLFLVRHSNPLIGDSMHVYPVREVDNNFFLTNRLADDPMFKLLYMLYRERLLKTSDGG